MFVLDRVSIFIDGSRLCLDYAIFVDVISHFPSENSLSVGR